MVVVGLPEDVLFGILIWLPVVSLLRCKAVCKSWRALIESTTFVTQHLHRGRNNNNDGLIVRHVADEEITETSCYRVLSGENYEVCVDMNPHWYPVSELTLCNSCDGIICLHHRHSANVALWNPATKQFRPLPQSPVPLRPSPVLEAPNKIEHLYYKDKNLVFPLLGFDVKTKDYKVVKIITHVTEEEEEDTSNTNCQVEVYSLSSDSWKIIHRGVLPINFPVKFIWRNPSISKDGKCFWLVTDQTYYGSETLLLSFDLSDEVFGSTMPLPDVCIARTYGLDFLNDKIVCIISSVPPDYCYYQGPSIGSVYCGSHFEIWVLHEYAVRDSWTKLYAVGADDFIPQLLSNNKDSLLVVKYPNEGCHAHIFLYDVAAQEMKNLHAQESLWKDTIILHYNESLVSIRGAVNAMVNLNNRATC